jgi:hypothetical protein
MQGIHDVFLAHDNDANHPISEKKLSKGEGEMSTTKQYWDLISTESKKQCG